MKFFVRNLLGENLLVKTIAETQRKTAEGYITAGIPRGGDDILGIIVIGEYDSAVVSLGF